MRATKATLLPLLAFLLGVTGSWLVFREGGGEAGAASQAHIIFYSEPNFQGRELHLYDTAVDLPFEDLPDGTQVLWNDRVGSFVVMAGTWRLYQHGRMNTVLDETPRELLDVAAKPCASGWSSLLSATSRGPLRIAAPELAGIGGDISSVELISPQNLPDWVYAR